MLDSTTKIYKKIGAEAKRINNNVQNIGIIRSGIQAESKRVNDKIRNINSDVQDKSSQINQNKVQIEGK